MCVSQNMSQQCIEWDVKMLVKMKLCLLFQMPVGFSAVSVDSWLQRPHFYPIDALK